ncbi:hypothetical protein ACFL7M_19100, partial [Thermodesulfobacteriota bacterium]
MTYHNKSFYYFFNYKFFILLLAIIFIIFFESSVNARQVNLEWASNSESDLSHYMIYWGTDPRDYTDNSGNIGLVTTFSLAIPDDGQIYYFAVTAFDDEGLESEFSNEVNTGEISDNNPPIASAGPDQDVNEGV